MRFSTALDLQILKDMIGSDSQLSEYGETRVKFSDALDIFFSTVSPASFGNVFARPTWKSLNDQFKKLITDHRTAVPRNIKASGII